MINKKEKLLPFYNVVFYNYQRGS